MARKIKRFFLIAAAVFIVAGILAPFISASAFRGGIQRSLQSSLGRKVEFDAAHFTLFSGPGFLLDGVSISEDSRYGIEPFAYVPTLSVRLRLDRLLVGQIRAASLRLSDPSLNLVKREDGTWNVVELANRLAASHGGGLNLLPALEVSDGRIDFKFGTRKSIVYLANTDLSVYAGRSGKIVVDFSGSPARTDRAGNSFSHLHGSATWFALRNELEADATLDESNLSEVTELLEGHDVGIHGMISSHAQIRGPLSALSINGDLHLSDVRRWDLLPSSGERWRVRYSGGLDLFAHRLHLATIGRQPTGPVPVSLDMRLNNFLTAPSWVLVANLHDAPLDQMLPLASRLGINLPEGLSAHGMVDGAVGYSSDSGLAGGISIRDAVAMLPDLYPVHATTATATIYSDHVHLDPALIEQSSQGTVRAGGDYYFSGERASATVSADSTPIEDLKKTVAVWFASPSALSALVGGNATGKLQYQRERPKSGGPGFVTDWSGQLSVADASLRIPGVAVPLREANGDIRFDADSFELSQFSGRIGDEVIQGSYRYNARAKHIERVRIQIPEVDLADIEHWLSPALVDRSLFARLRFGRRAIPEWMATRNLEGEAAVHSLTAGGLDLGSVTARFQWRGTSLQILSARLSKSGAAAEMVGSLDLKGYSPRYRFRTQINGYPWGGGLVSAKADWISSGTGLEALRSLHATGTVSAEKVHLSPLDEFDSVSGEFALTFEGDKPKLQLANVQATQGDDTWTGDGATLDDGKLALDLEHEGHQSHFVSDLMPKSDSNSSGAGNAGAVTVTSERLQ